jgi:hypothetical protein
LKEVILEFLAIKLFYRSLDKDKGNSDHIATRLQDLSALLRRDQLPAGASAKNGGNRIYKEWHDQRAVLRKERDFLSSIIDNHKGLSPNVILNTLVHDAPVIDDIHFTTTIKNFTRKAYILHNVEKFTDLIKALYRQDALQNIKDIVLFDCMGRTLFSACNKTQLEQYKDEAVHIEHLIAISFGKTPFRLKQLIDKSDSIYQKHFDLSPNTILNKGTYIFQEHEVQQLSGVNIPRKNITWIKGAEEEVKNYWELTATLDMPQLRTIYVFNIFMAAITLRIANKIIDHLFNKQESENLFKEEVYEAIAELTEEEKSELKIVVNVLLKKVVEIWATAKPNVLRAVQHKSSIALIVPFSLVNDTIFDSEMRHFLPGIGFKLYSWKDVKTRNIRDKCILSINYRDTGKYPFNIFPSTFENNSNEDTFFLSYFLSAFFGKRYTQCEQTYKAQLNKRLTNSFRRKYLGVQDVEVIPTPLPDGMSFDDIDDDQDNDFTDPTDSVTVTYNDNSHTTFYPAKMLIVRRPEEHAFSVVRADELAEEECKDHKIQPLEELYDGLNLFEISPEEEKELEKMKLAYNIADKNKVLWKVLLARKRTEVTDEILYEHVGKATGDSLFVRYPYFREKWLDPKSELLIPRRRKHFRAICEYLALSPAYYRLKLKKSASEKWSKRTNTQKTNRLLTQMFNEGLFNDGVDWNKVRLDHLLTTHDLEANGITEDNVTTELQALVALLKENISMKVVTSATYSTDAP